MTERWEIEVKDVGTAAESVECRFYRNDFQLYGFEVPDVLRALDRLHVVRIRLLNFPLPIAGRNYVNNVIIGKAVYYREIPAIITAFDGERGLVRLRPDVPYEQGFPMEPWGDRDAPLANNRWEDLLSPHIFWSR